MAGHSKWANIKHRKGRQDAKRSKIWSKCSRAIIVAAKQGGGDTDTNLALRYAVEDAKAENMPKDTIAGAIRKGTGDEEGVRYESVLYEGYGPGGVGIMVEALTDNKNRTAPELRKLFENHRGNLGESGCVAFNFEQKGQILIPQATADEERVMDSALEAGAEDVLDSDEFWDVRTQPSQLMDVRDALLSAEFTVESAQVAMLPLNTVQSGGKDAQKLLGLLEALDDHDDVQKVHANFDIPDEELATLGP